MHSLVSWCWGGTGPNLHCLQWQDPYDWSNPGEAVNKIFEVGTEQEGKKQERYQPRSRKRCSMIHLRYSLTKLGDSKQAQAPISGDTELARAGGLACLLLAHP